MTRVATLIQTPLVKIHSFDHPENEIHVDGQLEVVPSYRITFLRSGEFRIVRKSGSWDLYPGDVLVSYPGMSQRIFHPVEGARDRCLGISFEPELVEDSLGRLPEADSVPKAQRSARSEFQVRMISDALINQDHLMVESMALAAAQMFLPGGKTFATWDSIERSFGWYRVRVQRVCDLMIEDFACDHSLQGLARIAQMSPFHLNRVFHYMVGIPLHSYVVRLRIAAAARNIRGGESITNAAYSVGFNSVSYFSRSFTKHFGISPKRYRDVKVQ